jgi:hypothetical protein
MSHLPVKTKLETVSSNLHYYVQKQVQLLSLLSMNKCSVLSCYWITTSKQTTKQHPLIGNDREINKYTQPLLGNAFANKTNSYGNAWSTTMEELFSVYPCRGVMRRANGARKESCQLYRSCEEEAWSVQLKNLHC